jgi:hypothetical protein
VDASSTSFRSDERKLGSLDLSVLIRAETWALAVREDSPFCKAKAAKSWALLVRGRFNFRAGSVGSGEGDKVGSFRFLAALGSFSISRARSKAFHALISSRDSGSGVGTLGTRGRDGRGTSMSSKAAVSLNRLLPPCLSAISNRRCQARNSLWLASSRRCCCRARSTARSSSKGKSRSRLR